MGPDPIEELRQRTGETLAELGAFFAFALRPPSEGKKLTPKQEALSREFGWHDRLDVIGNLISATSGNDPKDDLTAALRASVSTYARWLLAQSTERPIAIEEMKKASDLLASLPALPREKSFDFSSFSDDDFHQWQVLLARATGAPPPSPRKP
jgi:hypothetical protein